MRCWRRGGWMWGDGDGGTRGRGDTGTGERGHGEMEAGQLRHRVTIQQATETTDGFGGVTQAWATFATVWAAVEPLTGREYLQGAPGAGECDDEDPDPGAKRGDGAVAGELGKPSVRHRGGAAGSDECAGDCADVQRGRELDGESEDQAEDPRG